MNFLIFFALVCADESGVIDVPRMNLEKHAYMALVYEQARLVGATPQQIQRLKYIAHGESRGNPRVCGIGGCGPFQHTVISLVPKRLRKVAFARRVVRWLLTNKPGFAATTALDLLRGCEKLSGEEWRCCYGGAYRPKCRVKWDVEYRGRQKDASL